uniref:Spindle pole body component 110 n=2 Tax=Anthurium amnicola TaxID=1678845 RepID=A0A1D1XKV1_9ARAE
MARGSVDNSSSSSSSSDGEEEEVVLRDTDRISTSKAFPRPAPATTASSSSAPGAGEEERGGGYAEPESPGGSSNSGDGGKQSPSEVSVSEGESSSSEGVLVEHPLNPDQDSRCLHVDPDSGVLVNIDGSMQEGDREAEDAGREDNFVDAPDQLSFSEGRGSGGLGESMPVINVGQSNREKTLVEEVARLSAHLEGTSNECRKYKEEIEVYGREIVNLHRQLQTMVDCRSGLVSADNTKVEGGEEGEHLTSLIPLNVMVNDCSKLASHLKNDLDEQLQSEGYATELNAIVCAKDQAIEELNMKVSENSLSHDVVFSYLTSVREMWVESLKHTTDAAARRLLAALRTVLPEDDEYPEDSIIPGIPLVERRTAMLVEKHSRIMSDIEQLGQCLAAVRSDFVLPKQNEVGTVFDAARQELLESKSKESYFLETIDELRKEKDGMLEQLDTAKHDLEEAKAETSKTKTELEQAENKFVTAKEKLSMAVTKGKSLVQQRESLKHSLTEKTGELEKCLLELQQKSDALEATKASVEELSKSQNLVLSLQDLLSQKNKVLHEIEEVVSQIDYPNDLRPMEVVDRVRWLVDQKQFAEGVLLESRKLKDALSSFDLPESVSTSDLEYQMRWLLDSFTQSKDDITKLQRELASTQSAVILCESQLLEARKEIDSLTTSVSKGKQEIDSLQVSHEDLMCKYEGIVEKFSQVSFEKNQLMQALIELSESTGDYQSFSELDTVIRECIGKIRLWKNNSIESSLAKSEQFQSLQALLYVRNQEVVLSEMILEEELLDRTVILNLSNELNQASEDVLSLTNERESLQKEIERLEEKCSMLREKLSMAVKKGKGLVQEREGFKYSLDEKNSEIEKLKHDLQLQESAVIELNEQVKILSSDLEHSQQLEASMVSLKEERDQFEWSLQESKDSLKRVTDLIYGISLPTSINSEEPAEKLKRIGEYIHEIEVVKASAEQELENIKVETLTQATQLADAYATIRSLEDSLSQADKNISVIIEEKEEAKLGKLSAEQELEKVKEDSGSLAGKLVQSFVTINNLQDALSQAENSISILTDEKNGVESRCKEEIVSLNEKLAACMNELAGTRGSLESQSSELINHLRNLQMLMKDQGLFVMMTERFKKNAQGLKNLGILIQRFHDKFAARALEEHPDSEALQQDTHLRKLLSIPQFEDYINDKMVTMDSMVFVSVEDIPSFSKVLEASGNQMKHIMDRFRDFSAYVDEHITLLLQALQTTINEVDGIVEHREKLTSDMNNLEAHNQVQEVKISALQNSMSMLLSACRKASQDLHIKFHDILDMDFIAEYKKDDSSLVPASGEEDGDGIEDQGINNSTDEYGMAATELLAAARRVNSETQQFARLKSMWLAAVDDLKKKLREAELAAEAAIQDKNATNAIILKLEADVKELHSSSKQMNLMMEDRQMKEDLLKDKEAEISSLQHKLAEKEKEEGKKLFLEEQLKQLYDRISMMEIPFKELELDVEGHSFSNPVDKFFYVVDNVSKLQHLIKSLSLEREVSQSILADHFHELEKLRKASENYVIINQDLEERKNDLIELSVGLEKIIQKLGGYDFFDHKKSFDVKGLLQLLESLIITSIQDSESLKSRVQELGDQLKASQTLNEELSSSVKLLEGSIHARPPLPDVSKEKAISEASSVATGSEISEIEDGGPIGKRSLSPVPAAAHVRVMRKGSSDHLALNIDPESERLISPREIDDKGHVFKSLNTSGLIPKQGKHIADRIDGIWVSAGRILMSRPEARIGLIAYSFLLHIWVLGTIL